MEASKKICRQANPQQCRVHKNVPADQLRLPEKRTPGVYSTGARQQHGFDYQNNFIRKHNLKESAGYTDPFDAYTADGVPVSIKTHKENAPVELADIHRNMAIRENFYLVVSSWRGSRSNIVSEHILYVKWDEFQSYFETTMIDRLRKILADATHERSYDAVWKSQTKEFKQDWKNSVGDVINPCFKRDHKSQKRVQCAISNKAFTEIFIPKYAASFTVKPIV